MAKITSGTSGTISDSPVSSSDTPSNPTAVSNNQMFGLGEAITPGSTGRVLVIVTGTLTGATGDTVGAQISYGTGAAPANGAAKTGTQVGNVSTVSALTGALTQPFTCVAVITGLTPGTAYWLDCNGAASAGTCGPQALSFVAIEF